MSMPEIKIITLGEEKKPKANKQEKKKKTPLNNY